MLGFSECVVERTFDGPVYKDHLIDIPNSVNVPELLVQSIY